MGQNSSKQDSPEIEPAALRRNRVKAKRVGEQDKSRGNKPHILTRTGETYPL